MSCSHQGSLVAIGLCLAPSDFKKKTISGWSFLKAVVYFVFFQSASQLPYGKALYTYEGKEPGDLKFNKGDIIILRRKVDENWYHGELNGNHGFFPASYIQCIKPLPQAPPQGKALYDFEIKDKDQDKDCLTFTKVGESLLLQGLKGHVWC